MRQIATLPEEQARPFADYLLTLGIPTHLAGEADGTAVWVRREDQVGRAREELESYRRDPDAARYRDSRREADAIRRKDEQADREHARRTVDLRTRIGRPGLGLGPLTKALLAVSVGAFVLQYFIGLSIGGRSLYQWLYFTEWYRLPRGDRVDAGLELIGRGQLWRLVTPIFVHGGIPHLLFNMYMLVQLGSLVERRRGTAEFAALVLVSAIASNVAQWAFPDVFTVPSARTGNGPFGGMSGVLYALFGYAWMLGTYDPSAGFRIPSQTVALLLIWLVVCFFNLLGPIANTAHVAGLVAGLAFAAATLVRDGHWP